MAIVVRSEQHFRRLSDVLDNNLCLISITSLISCQIKKLSVQKLDFDWSGSLGEKGVCIISDRYPKSLSTSSRTSEKHTGFYWLSDIFFCVLLTTN